MKKVCDHLKNDRDFKRVYNKGRSFVSPVLVTYCFKKKYGDLRFGITTGKKTGGAVQRNRCRRIIREAYRQLSDKCAGSWDIVFVARVRTCSAKTQDIYPYMLSHLISAGVIPRNAMNGGKQEDPCIKR